ncbi:hypothetical protein A3A39_01600 [Candidatus Kaiserbacteria bacterium RIFCSPLOWO2_01_FULL_54_13]|uniref:Serine protease n=1 Tax=Candidatus Kaiserbacteria bacterium RIFCSPLOWO2_01_FULL_54_13 TaxID=1798512 RepID=A0A1F6F3W5_9BACT|nr:MAG: hypothetical protein A3A39_01600 [Candidatus Kaiserbacteria bacterium RIFCSPLOWO2_01_FULL_54_13]
MDMEELNKSQIILLTLLVSFVTSIATGIVTVSLMEQAPPAFTQTVNRVVERTVERIVPSGQTASTVVTTEKTVVVKESDLIVEAVKKMTPSLVQVYSQASEPVFLGLGIVLDGSGSVVTDASILGEAVEVGISLSDGSRTTASVTSRSNDTGMAILQSATTTSDGKALSFTPAVISVGKPDLGQTVVVLSGKSIPRIADGLVTALVPQAEGTGAVIDTNISADFVMEGSPLVNTEGALLGVSTQVSRTSSPRAFMPSSVLVKSSEPETKKPEAGE